MLNQSASIAAGPARPSWTVHLSDNGFSHISEANFGTLCVLRLYNGREIIGIPVRGACPGKFDVEGWAGHANAFGQDTALVCTVDRVVPAKSALRNHPLA